MGKAVSLCPVSCFTDFPLSAILFRKYKSVKPGEEEAGRGKTSIWGNIGSAENSEKTQQEKAHISCSRFHQAFSTFSPLVECQTCLNNEQQGSSTKNEVRQCTEEVPGNLALGSMTARNGYPESCLHIIIWPDKENPNTGRKQCKAGYASKDNISNIRTKCPFTIGTEFHKESVQQVNYASHAKKQTEKLHDKALIILHTICVLCE